MKFCKLFFIGILVFCVCSTQAIAQESLRSAPLYSEITDVFKTSGTKGLTSMIEQKTKDAGSHAIFLQWLKDEMLVKFNPEPFISLYYSDLLYVAAESYKKSGHQKEADGLFETSFFPLRIFHLMALTDAARCNDSSVNGALVSLISQRYSYFKPMKDTVLVANLEKSKDFALKYEEKLKNRAPSPTVCNSGIKAMSVAMNDPNRTETVVENKDFVGGKNVEVKASKPFVPDYLPDAEWQKKRQEVRENFSKFE